MYSVLYLVYKGTLVVKKTIKLEYDLIKASRIHIKRTKNAFYGNLVKKCFLQPLAQKQKYYYICPFQSILLLFLRNKNLQQVWNILQTHIAFSLVKIVIFMNPGLQKNRSAESSSIIPPNPPVAYIVPLSPYFALLQVFWKRRNRLIKMLKKTGPKVDP